MAVTTPAGVPLHRLSAGAYQQIVEAGALDGEHVELLGGIMTEMSPQSAAHAAIAEAVALYLAPAGRVRSHSPFEIAGADSLPEPDVLLTDEPRDASRHPRTARVVVEVAISSQPVDRDIKAPLYALAGVPVYWLIDVPARVIEVRSEPLAGSYSDTVLYRVGEILPAPAAGLPGLPVAELLPAS